MSDSNWSFELGGSWFSDQESAKSKIFTRYMEIILGAEAIVVVALLQGLVDLEEESFVNPEGELSKDPEEELPRRFRRRPSRSHSVRNSGSSIRKTAKQVPNSLEF